MGQMATFHPKPVTVRERHDNEQNKSRMEWTAPSLSQLWRCASIQSLSQTRRDLLVLRHTLGACSCRRRPRLGNHACGATCHGAIIPHFGIRRRPDHGLGHYYSTDFWSCCLFMDTAANERSVHCPDLEDRGTYQLSPNRHIARLIKRKNNSAPSSQLPHTEL